ncbi:MAG: alpha/beta hydrolase, partial [Candidatus Kapaibacterium sp.]
YYDQVAKFNFPVLLLHGKHDAMPIAADELAKEKIPNATLEVFKKSGHFIFVEENKKFTSAIQKFMGR